jgi:hypothetical protein
MAPAPKSKSRTDQENMNMKQILLAFLFLGAIASGCATSYSSIRQVQGNTYMVTRVQQGLFSVSSDLLRCEANGPSMTCSQVAEH